MSSIKPTTELKSAVAAHAAALARERELDSEMAAAQRRWFGSQQWADAPSVELIDRWALARRETEVAWRLVHSLRGERDSQF